MSKPILCLDFDGVIHSYESGWKGAAAIPDDPVPGAAEFIRTAHEHFAVQVYSARSGQDGGIEAMRAWCHFHLGHEVANMLAFPMSKPPAFVSLDDRVLTFEGVWPDVQALREFKPWNKREA